MSEPELLVDDLRSAELTVRQTAANEILEVLQPVVSERDGFATRVVDPQLDGEWWFEQLADVYRASDGQHVESAWLLSKVPPSILTKNRAELECLIEIAKNLASLQQLTIAVRTVFYQDGPLCVGLLGQIESALSRLRQETDANAYQEIRNLLRHMQKG